eukprot:CAMPEP_0119038334 /NCGR_PEP_ID=MMETSP1177-20130426/7190_1 /TAXON_ID=2985 /ORGANISM="Ochromonas sp, Strain CCMP1899" /LENGTH=280 /DNA_ID=CAMNT_0007000781 /DNA_START=699 /DNA_END=1538 /DNA_ORIENTATION=-
MGAKVATCASLSERSSVSNKIDTCTSTVLLDQGYEVYHINVATPAHPYRQPLVIFASVHKFPAPEWAKDKDEEALYKDWKPFKLNRRYPTNYGYVKMTNWYAYHMLDLKIIDFFDYAAKLDNDVSFVAPFPAANLPLKLADKGIKMMGTQEKWYFDDPRVSNGLKQCLTTYVDKESQRCQKLSKLKPIKSTHNDNLWLKPGGINSRIFWEGNTLNATFRAHFLVFWLGIYAAPETKDMAKHWNEFHPRGMWDYRWGDQQWWPRPIAMYGTGNVSADLYKW